MALYLARADRVVIGADLTRASLLLGKAAAGRFGLQRVMFVETDMRHAGLKHGAFDVVYCSGVLHHTPNPRASFAELATLARPGGTIVLGVYNAFARVPSRMRRARGEALAISLRAVRSGVARPCGEPARRDAWLRDQYLHPKNTATRLPRCSAGLQRTTSSS
jgi:2-polyprenyl-3-methyl-5-hydroxy-6-metoxy-1,4-benzoquinol methylase